MRICLDTSAYSNFRREDNVVVEIISRADWIGIPVTVLGELEAGFRGGSHYTDNKSHLDLFMSHPLVQIIDTTRHIAEIYGEIVEQQKLAGNPLSANDLWVAAATARVGATLVTYDRQFKSLARIGTICL